MNKDGIKISKAIHRIANADIKIGPFSFPCHSAALDMESPLYDAGYGKKRAFSLTVVIPLYDKLGKPYDVETKVKVDDRLTITSRCRASLSVTVRVASIAIDEASISLFSTDLNR